jgi:hypothetical protein
VTIHPKEQDNFGRTVAWVVLPDNRNLNSHLVSNGYGWWYLRHAPTESLLQSNEQHARQKKLGLWEDPAPVAPWTYRKDDDAATPAAAVAPQVQHKPAAQASSAPTYVIAPTGSKYHKPDCRTLKETTITVTKADAESRGYEPCKVCDPY